MPMCGPKGVVCWHSEPPDLLYAFAVFYIIYVLYIVIVFYIYIL